MSKTLNVSRIKFYAEEKNISLRSLATMVEMSSMGFNKAINNETIRATKLFEVMEILELNFYDLVEYPTDYNELKEPTQNIDSVHKKSFGQLLRERAAIQKQIDDFLLQKL